MSLFPLIKPVRKRAARSGINRAPSPILAMGMPWLAVMVGSIVPNVLFVTSAPLVPPLGFLIYIAWRQLRPGLLPVWAGLPLGLFDDLYSGQPFGSGALLWSLVAIVLDVVEARLPWRNFLTEWLVATVVIAVYIVLGLAFANLAGGSTALHIIVPQIVISILIYPLIGRLVALLDRIRLARFMEIR